MNRLRLALPLVILLGAAAHADVVHLHNGRTMEGEVVQRGRGLLKLKVPGGMLQIPLSTVKRVEQRRTPHEEYALRSRRTDMSDPIALDALAFWASKRGLGERAKQLRAQAAGIRLQARVDAVRGTRRASDYLEIYRWARQAAYSETVQRWLLDRALEVEPAHRASKAALRAMVEAEEAREVARQERAETAHRKAEERKRTSRERKERERRIDQLESQLEEQKTESQQLRERLEELERIERGYAHAGRVRRRHRRNKNKGQGYKLVFVAPGIWARKRVDCEPPPVNEPRPAR